jgi:hypothetical protein
VFEGDMVVEVFFMQNALSSQLLNPQGILIKIYTTKDHTCRCAYYKCDAMILTYLHIKFEFRRF